ncbi:MAG: M48 family metallopeptidase [Candidatus Polarisedimenticolaceae bacterium]|nr:M48 family metallopeptidase [Candidatus Polarisedimenticolaceae bacterium]
MDFFTAQDKARKSTTLLVFYFIFAIISLILLTNVLITGVVTWMGMGTHDLLSVERIKSVFEWRTFGLVGAGVTVVVLVGSLYKMAQLNSGGRVVAESLGGKLVSQNSQDPLQRKLLNVVEEMAIAAGTPVPPVYILQDEVGINAFAAGLSPSDAVIGVTRGCIEELSRDQLQGVMAHEFSHILNGDMRLNIRLMGVLHGILIIGIIGYYILRSMGYSRHHRSSRNSGNSAVVQLVLGGGLVVIGYVGTLYGNLIKASVSRQREYLADASAVQFTRNPEGIAGALKRIGGYKAHAYIESSAVSETSHLFFGTAVDSFFGAMFSTHPPLEKRIRTIQPHWDGKFDKRVSETKQAAEAETSTNKRAASNVAVVTVAAEAMQALGTVGQLDSAHIDYARRLIDGVPAAIQTAVREPYSARVVIYLLLISPVNGTKKQQLAHLHQHGDEGGYQLTLKLLPLIDSLEISARLPLIDLAIASLRQLSMRQYLLFKQNLAALIKADSRISLFEWALQRILLHHLDADFNKRPAPRAKYGSLHRLKAESELLLSLLAYAEQSASAEEAFNAAKEIMQREDLSLLPKADLNLSKLNSAIDRLAQLKPLAKPQLLKACVTVITADGQVTAKETELIRAFAAALDCPLPPMLVVERH